MTGGLLPKFLPLDALDTELAQGTVGSSGTRSDSTPHGPKLSRDAAKRVSAPPVRISKTCAIQARWLNTVHSASRRSGDGEPWRI
jgi:hypothetical protein